MPRCSCHLICLLLATSPAAAWDGVQVSEAEGHLRQHCWYAPSPTPGYCYWDHLPAAGPTFTAANPDGHGNMGCPDPWFVHCDADSLVYEGAWPVTCAENVTGLEYAVDLACTVEILAPTRLVAACAVTAGDLDTDEHRLTLTHPDDSCEVLLAGGGENAVRTLPPGVYGVILQVGAYEHVSYGEVVEAYAGRVVLRWEDPTTVDAEPRSWGALKAAFRR